MSVTTYLILWSHDRGYDAELIHAVDKQSAFTFANKKAKRVRKSSKKLLGLMPWTRAVEILEPRLEGGE